jgi:hypothetical protein
MYFGLSRPPSGDGDVLRRWRRTMTAALRKMIDTEQTAAKTGISPARQKKLRDTGQFCRWYRHGRRIY